MIKIYTDGSCLGNPGPGASAFIVVKNGQNIHSDVVLHTNTTNNFAELSAIAMALIYINDNDIEECKIFCDSKYVVDGICTWMETWVNNGWRASHGKQICNMDLWKDIYRLWKNAKSISNCSVHYVKSHYVDQWNKTVDKIARDAVKTNLYGNKNS